MEFRKHFRLSPRQLPHSYDFSRVINIFMASGDASPFKLPAPPRTKIIEESIDAVRKLVEEKPNFPFSRCQQQWTCLRVLCDNIHINLKLSKVLPINTNHNTFCDTNRVDYNFVIGRYLSTNWNPSIKELIVNFLFLIFSPKTVSSIGNKNNIIITIQLDEQLYIITHYFCTVASDDPVVVRSGLFSHRKDLIPFKNVKIRFKNI